MQHTQQFQIASTSGQFRVSWKKQSAWCRLPAFHLRVAIVKKNQRDPLSSLVSPCHSIKFITCAPIVKKKTGATPPCLPGFHRACPHPAQSKIPARSSRPSSPRPFCRNTSLFRRTVQSSSSYIHDSRGDWAEMLCYTDALFGQSAILRYKWFIDWT
jgi:hypothetical protein